MLNRPFKMRLIYIVCRLHIAGKKRSSTQKEKKRNTAESININNFKIIYLIDAEI